MSRRTLTTAAGAMLRASSRLAGESRRWSEQPTGPRVEPQIGGTNDEPEDAAVPFSAVVSRDFPGNPGQVVADEAHAANLRRQADRQDAP